MKQIFYSTLICLAACHSPHSKESTLCTLPSFNMLLVDSLTVLKAQEIPTGEPIVLLFFRPDCPHCRQETQDLVDHIDSFKNVRFYLLALEPMKEIKEFYLDFHLADYKNITVGKDSEHSFLRVFRPGTVPYMAIYDGHKQLVKIYNGGAGVDRILKAIHV